LVCLGLESESAAGCFTNRPCAQVGVHMFCTKVADAAAEVAPQLVQWIASK
jgi:hypothetical protein